jgi:hypothetical protein
MQSVEAAGRIPTISHELRKEFIPGERCGMVPQSDVHLKGIRVTDRGSDLGAQEGVRAITTSLERVSADALVVASGSMTVATNDGNPHLTGMGCPSVFRCNRLDVDLPDENYAIPLGDPLAVPAIVDDSCNPSTFGPPPGPVNSDFAKSKHETIDGVFSIGFDGLPDVASGVEATRAAHGARDVRLLCD